MFIYVEGVCRTPHVPSSSSQQVDWLAAVLFLASSLRRSRMIIKTFYYLLQAYLLQASSSKKDKRVLPCNSFLLPFTPVPFWPHTLKNILLTLLFYTVYFPSYCFFSLLSESFLAYDYVSPTREHAAFQIMKENTVNKMFFEDMPKI